MHKEHIHRFIWRKLYNASLTRVRSSRNRGNSDHFLRLNQHIYKERKNTILLKKKLEKMVEPKKCTCAIKIKKVQKYNRSILNNLKKSYIMR